MNSTNSENTGFIIIGNQTNLIGGRNDSGLDVTIKPPAPPLLNSGDSNEFNFGKNPNLVSSEVNEVLSSPPAWLVRWGITLFFILLMLLISITWFIQYPDLVSGNIKIIANNYPKSIVSKSESRITKLLINDGQNIQIGQKLIFFESSANHSEVLALDSISTHLINHIQADSTESLYYSLIPSFFQLGELQKSFQIFQESFVKVKSLINNGSYLQKRKIFIKDLQTITAIKSSLQSQLEISKQDYGLAEDEFDRQKNLLNEKAISKNDYNILVSKLLSKKQNLEQIRSNIKNQDFSYNQKQSEILELDKSIIEQKNAFVQSLYSLKSEIESWKLRFIAVAPISGVATFIDPIQESEVIKAGQELLSIIPSGTGFHGEMALGQYNFGKVKKGQELIIKLKSHPYEEFGIIRGSVQEISEIPKDSTYLVRVIFPMGLVTSTKQTIPFKNGMVGTGEIITENKRLIQRFFNELQKLMGR